MIKSKAMNCTCLGDSSGSVFKRDYFELKSMIWILFKSSGFMFLDVYYIY